MLQELLVGMVSMANPPELEAAIGSADICNQYGIVLMLQHNSVPVQFRVSQRAVRSIEYRLPYQNTSPLRLRKRGPCKMKRSSHFQVLPASSRVQLRYGPRDAPSFGTVP